MTDNESIDLKSTSDFINANLDKYVDSDEYTKVEKKKYSGDTTETFFLILFDWRFIFFSILILTLIVAYGFGVAYKYLEKSNIYDKYALNGISFAFYMFILNACIANFTLSNYFKRKSNKGKKGPMGNVGPRGESGKDQTCDICSLKVKKFQRDESVNKNDLIDVDKLYDELNNNDAKKWNSKNINKILGESCNDCKYSKNANVNYINGIIANYDNIITSLQYLYKNNDGKIDILGGERGLWGDKNKKNKVKQIKCPKNSAIYKIDTLHDPSEGFKGIEIHCKNINTGEIVEPKQKYIGKKPEQTSHHKFSSASCNNINNNPSFISNVECKYNDNKIKTLLFKSCKYYS